MGSKCCYNGADRCVNDYSDNLFNFLPKSSKPEISSPTVHRVDVPASMLPLLLTTQVITGIVSDTWITAISGFFLTLATDLQMMPADVLVAQIAKRGLEGSVYSLFTVTEGFGRVVSNIYSGVVPVEQVQTYVGVHPGKQRVPAYAKPRDRGHRRSRTGHACHAVYRKGR